MAKITRSTATTSWIDERLFSPTLPEVDWGSEVRYTNNQWVHRPLIIGEEAYRFANFLEAFIEVQNRRIVSHGFTNASRLYRAPSFFEIESEPFATRRQITTSARSVTFKQLVGCRTRSPEVVAEVIGSVAGAVIGGVLASPFGAVVPGGIGGGVVGHRVGREVVEEFMVFPPIWTELSLTIFIDGRSESELVRHSLFPSLCLFSQNAERRDLYHREELYDARAILDTWKQRGWGAGNPWHIPEPRGWGDNRRHASLTRGSRTGHGNFNGPVRGSVASQTGSVLGGSSRPGPHLAIT
jgi:hypothetical protein